MLVLRVVPASCAVNGVYVVIVCVVLRSRVMMLLIILAIILRWVTLLVLTRCLANSNLWVVGMLTVAGSRQATFTLGRTFSWAKGMSNDVDGLVQ